METAEGIDLKKLKYFAGKQKHVASYYPAICFLMLLMFLSHKQIILKFLTCAQPMILY